MHPSVRGKEMISSLSLWQALRAIPLFPIYLPIFCIIVSLLYLFKFKRSDKLNLPPSPPKLPFIGNLHQLGKLPHVSLGALSEKYGPLMYLHLGKSSALVVSSADLAKEIFKKHDLAFSNRPQTTIPKILLYGCTDVGFAAYGEHWRQARKLCVLDLLTLKNVQSLRFIREEEVSEMVDKIREASLNHGSVSLGELLVLLTNNIVCRSIFGKKFETEKGKSKVGHLARVVMAQLTAFSVGDFFPFLGWLDVLTGLIARCKALFVELDALFDQVIAEHKKVKKKDGESYRKDFVDMLLQLKEDGALDYNFTEDNFKAILLDMFLGGSDTTSTTLEWAMAELIRNPSVMKKAQEEVRRVVGTKSKIDEKDINQMNYLKCVIKETFRTHPACPIVPPRETMSSVKLGGYDIPEKTRVLINAWAIQRDSKLWERPEEFFPERFEGSQVDFKGQHFQYIPFGAGRRGCPGMLLGVAIIENTLANLLCWFDWNLPKTIASPEHLDMGEVNGIVVSKKVPLQLVPVSYFSQS